MPSCIAVGKKIGASDQDDRRRLHEIAGDQQNDVDDQQELPWLQLAS